MKALSFPALLMSEKHCFVCMFPGHALCTSEKSNMKMKTIGTAGGIKSKYSNED